MKITVDYGGGLSRFTFQDIYPGPQCFPTISSVTLTESELISAMKDWLEQRTKYRQWRNFVDRSMT